MKGAIILSISLIFSLAAIAQETPSADHKAPTKAFGSAPQSPEMKKFIDTFAGRWKTTITVEKNEWFPVAGTAKGRADIQAGPAGNSTIERQRSNSPLGNFAGTGVYWYDAESKSYKGIWCDSMDPRGCGDIGSGNWEGANFVINNEVSTPQGKLRIRETFSNITHDSYDFVIESSTGAAPLKKMMTIKYQRSASQPHNAR